MYSPQVKLAAQCVDDTYWAVDKLDDTLDVSGVFIGLKDTPDYTIVCFRGSTSFLDWWRDFENAAQMIRDPELGYVHPGFLAGMRDAFGAITRHGADGNKSLIITGHSLGAARAWIFAALMGNIKDFNHKDEVIVFGSPLPGDHTIKDLVSPYVKIAFKNRFDPVCDVPLAIPFLDPYVRPVENIRLNESPPADDPWGIIADHHFELYYTAIMRNA